MSYNVQQSSLQTSVLGKKLKKASSKAGLWALLGVVKPCRLQKYVLSKGWKLLN